MYLVFTPPFLPRHHWVVWVGLWGDQWVSVFTWVFSRVGVCHLPHMVGSLVIHIVGRVSVGLVCTWQAGGHTFRVWEAACPFSIIWGPGPFPLGGWPSGSVSIYWWGGGVHAIIFSGGGAGFYHPKVFTSWAGSQWRQTDSKLAVPVLDLFSQHLTTSGAIKAWSTARVVVVNVANKLCWWLDRHGQMVSLWTNLFS